jgi:hypothetical protein
MRLCYVGSKLQLQQKIELAYQTAVIDPGLRCFVCSFACTFRAQIQHTQLILDAECSIGVEQIGYWGEALRISANKKSVIFG